MSATICYRISKPNASLQVAMPSRFMSICEKIFGALPKTFGQSDLERLYVLQKLHDDSHDWDKLIALIERNGDVDVWAEY